MYNLSIVISSPIQYRDIFESNAQLFDKYWSSCPYDKIYATDYLANSDYKGFKVLERNQSRNWVDRMLCILPEIKSKYIMVITDDAFIVNEINDKDIDELLNFIYENKIIYCRMYKNASFKNNRYYLAKNIFQLYYKQSYGRSLLAGIWDKEYLELTLLGFSNNAWDIEEKWLKEAYHKGDEAIEGNIYYHNNYFYHGVYKGLWMRNARNVLKKHGVNIISSRKKISIIQSVVIFIKKQLRDLFSPKLRYKIKKVLAKIIKMDTKH